MLMHLEADGPIRFPDVKMAVSCPPDVTFSIFSQDQVSERCQVIAEGSVFCVRLGACDRKLRFAQTVAGDLLATGHGPKVRPFEKKIH
jgi:hypothetical protein